MDLCSLVAESRLTQLQIQEEEEEEEDTKWREGERVKRRRKLGRKEERRAGIFSAVGSGQVTWATATLLPKNKRRKEKRGSDEGRGEKQMMRSRREERLEVAQVQTNCEKERLFSGRGTE